MTKVLMTLTAAAMIMVVAFLGGCGDTSNTSTIGHDQSAPPAAVVSSTTVPPPSEDYPNCPETTPVDAGCSAKSWAACVCRPF